MRLLLIHAKEFEFHITRKALKKEIEHPETPRSGSYENVLVVFTTVEEGDNGEVIRRACREVLEVASNIMPSSILIYPYAHLSSRLAEPEKALSILDEFTKILGSEAGIPVSRAPFGYYKEFKLHCYGHPLAELSKTIRPSSKPAPLRTYIVKGGELSEADAGENLSKKLLSKAKIPDKLLGFMEKFGYMVHYNTAIYLPPYSIMIRVILEQEKRILAEKLGVRPDSITVLGGLPDKPVASIIGRGEPLIYDTILQGGETAKFMIGEPVSPKLEHSVVIELSNTEPIERILEAGEHLTGYHWGDMKHIAFIGPGHEDLHESLMNLLVDGDLVTEIAGLNRIILVGISVERDLHIPLTLMELYPTGKNNHVLRVLPVISAERLIISYMARAYRDYTSGKTPSVPLWLSPIQVRIIPVRKEFLEHSLSIARRLRDEGFRVDVDDREKGLGRRIRDAGREWIPYIVIIGEREVKSNTLNVRVRRTNDQLIMTLDEFVSHLRRHLRGYKNIVVRQPLLVSERKTELYKHLYEASR